MTSEHNGEIPELEAHRRLVYMLAESQLATNLRSKLDAEDIVQETMLLAYRNFDQLVESNNSAIVKNCSKSGPTCRAPCA